MKHPPATCHKFQWSDNVCDMCYVTHHDGSWALISYYILLCNTIWRITVVQHAAIKLSKSQIVPSRSSFIIQVPTGDISDIKSVPMQVYFMRRHIFFDIVANHLDPTHKIMGAKFVLSKCFCIFTMRFDSIYPTLSTPWTNSRMSWQIYSKVHSQVTRVSPRLD